MNKFTYALALGAGLVLSLAVPNAQADPIVQTLTPTTMSAAQFNSLFTASTPVLTSNYQFMNTPVSGVVESQVFTGNSNSVASGVYAYAYQFGVNNVADSTTGQPTSVNSASMLFNATPVLTNFTGKSASSYVVTDGQVGAINLPQAAPGSVVQTPSSIAWLPSSTTGSLTFQYLNPTTSTGPLEAGAKSGTIVVMSTQPFTQQYVSIQNPEPQTGYPLAYSPTTGSIHQIPAPEPATILAWTSVLAALMVGHRYRRNHTMV
jgi:hypothetical protein